MPNRRVGAPGQFCRAPLKAVIANDSPSGLRDSLEKIPTALTTRQLSQIFQISSVVLYRLIKKNRIPHFRVGGSIRFDPGRIAEWVKDNSTEVSA